MNRRRLQLYVMGLIAALFPMAVAFSAESELRFDIYLNDSRIGFHHVTVDDSSDGRRVTVQAEMDVKLLFFNAYQYRHRAQEHWRGDCLQTLDARTNDDGELLSVRADDRGNMLEVVKPNEYVQLKGCVRSFAYWDPNLLNAERLLNTQTGEYEAVSLKRLEDGPFPFNDAQLPARQYRLEVGEDVAIDLWYSTDMRWLALETEVSVGTLRYLRQGDS